MSAPIVVYRPLPERGAWRVIRVEFVPGGRLAERVEVVAHCLTDAAAAAALRLMESSGGES